MPGAFFCLKIGWVNFRKSQNITGTPKNVTVSKQGAHWFVSVQVKQDINTPKHASSSIVGGDLGVKRLLTLSDGTYYDPIDTRKQAGKIKRRQKQLAKKVKFSNNWKKVKSKITALHSNVARVLYGLPPYVKKKL